MIEEYARVLEVFDDKIVIQIQPSSACGGCHARSACGQGLLSKYFNQTPGQLKIDKVLYSGKALNVAVEDELLVGIEEGLVLKGAFFAYLSPLLCVVFFAILAQWFQITSEAAQIVFVVLGLLLGLGGVKLLLHNSKSAGLLNNILPVVLDVVHRKESTLNKIAITEQL